MKIEIEVPDPRYRVGDLVSFSNGEHRVTVHVIRREMRPTMGRA